MTPADKGERRGVHSEGPSISERRLRSTCRGSGKIALLDSCRDNLKVGQGGSWNDVSVGRKPTGAN